MLKYMCQHLKWVCLGHVLLCGTKCICSAAVPCCAENTATINQQKRKLSRQHDVLLNLKGKYSRSDGKFCDENSKLTEEYKRITGHFKDMQVRAGMPADQRCSAADWRQVAAGTCLSVGR